MSDQAEQVVEWVHVLCRVCGGWTAHPADSDLALAHCGKCGSDQSPDGDE